MFQLPLVSARVTTCAFVVAGSVALQFHEQYPEASKGADIYILNYLKQIGFTKTKYEYSIESDSPSHFCFSLSVIVTSKVDIAGSIRWLTNDVRAAYHHNFDTVKRRLRTFHFIQQD